VAVGPVGIESNATTAAPEMRVSVPASVVSVPQTGITPQSGSDGATTTAAPASRSVVTRANASGDDNTKVGVTTHSIGTGLANGTLENDSSTFGTKIKRLFGLN